MKFAVEVEVRAHKDPTPLLSCPTTKKTGVKSAVRSILRANLCYRALRVNNTTHSAGLRHRRRSLQDGESAGILCFVSALDECASFLQHINPRLWGQ